MVSSIVEEEEVAAEVEAVQAVYGDDCMVLQSYPPHVHLLLKPHTADVTSQQVSFSLSLLFSIFVWLPRKRWKVKPKPRKDKRKTFETESKDHTFCFTQISCANFFLLQSLITYLFNVFRSHTLRHNQTT